jgi:hypothetical protein
VKNSRNRAKQGQNKEKKVKNTAFRRFEQDGTVFAKESANGVNTDNKFRFSERSMKK